MINSSLSMLTVVVHSMPTFFHIESTLVCISLSYTMRTGLPDERSAVVDGERLSQTDPSTHCPHVKGTGAGAAQLHNYIQYNN